MKIKELIEKLSGLDQEMEVILSADSEGNNYSPLSDGFGFGVYREETSWRGEFFSDSWTADEACMEEEEWNSFLENNPYAIVLWPIN